MSDAGKPKSGRGGSEQGKEPLSLMEIVKTIDRVQEALPRDMPGEERDRLVKFFDVLKDLIRLFCPQPMFRYMPVRPPGKANVRNP
jgi:hypothetical protein